MVVMLRIVGVERVLWAMLVWRFAPLVVVAVMMLLMLAMLMPVTVVAIAMQHIL